jgi:PAS domain S-box-containing protein
VAALSCLASLMGWGHVGLAAAVGPSLATDTPTHVAVLLRDGDNDAMPDALGQTFLVEGVLSADPLLVSSRPREPTWLLNLQDATGGIVLFVREAAALPPGLRRGERVRVTGVLSQYKGSEQLEVTTLEPRGQAPVPDPRVVQAADLHSEHYSGQLVRVSGELMTPPDVLRRRSGLRVRDASGEIAVFTSERFFAEAAFANRLLRGGRVEIVGIASQDDSDPPFDSGYRLVPRDSGDFRFSLIPPYRTLVVGGGVLALIALSSYLWLSHRTATRHAQELTQLADSLRRSQEALRQSEERFRRAFEEGPVGVILASPDSRVLRANRALCQMLGYSEDELLGLAIVDVMPPADAEHHLAQARRLFSGELSQYQIEHRFVTRTQDVLWAKITTSLLSNPEGKPQYALSIVEDITERKRVEEALKFTQIAIDHSADAAYWMRPDGQFTYVNEAACRALGYSREELLTRSVHDVDLAFPAETWSECWREIQDRKTFTLESQHRTIDGRLFPVEVRVNWLTFGGREFNCAFARDITQRKRAEEALERSESALRKLIDAAPFGAHQYELQADGRLVFVGANRAADRILGVNHRAFIGRAIEEAFPALVDTPIVETYRQVAREGSPFETDLVTYKDRTISGSFEVAAVQTSPNCMAAFFRDVTERKRAEEALRASEERFSKVFHASPVAITLATLEEGRFIDTNDSFLHLVEYQREELIGKTALELGLWLSAAHREQVIRQLVEAKSLRQIESQIRARSGEIRQCLAAAELIELNGQPCILSLVHDITERKRVEEALRKSEERFQLIARATNDTIWDWDLLSNRVWWNEGIKTVFGYSPQDVDADGNWWDQHIHSDDRERVLTGRNEVIQSGGHFWSGEYRYRRADGRYADVYDRAYVIHDPTGKPIRMLGAMMDITERKRFELELAQARDEALESARVKSEFLANISHEVRTPLNGIVGMTVLLNDTPLANDQQEYVETIKGSSETLLAIINDLLDFSKMEAGKLHFETLDFDLRATVESTIELLADRAQHKHIELVSLLQADVPTALRGDAGRLRQVITNLVVNAIKFTEEGEVALRVMVQKDFTTQVELYFAVSDTGIGIPAEAQASLFQAFSQVDGSTTRRHGGAGLGLAISKQIVERMGGRIGVESAPGTGSTFWFTARLEKQFPTEREAATPPAGLSGQRVLVVEDNKTNRELIVQYTTALHLPTSAVASAAEGLQVLREAVGAGRPFDLAVLDMETPDMDGLALAKVIKSDPAISATRLVLVTPRGPRNSTAVLRAAGIRAFLVKPVRRQSLIDCLTTALSHTAQHETRFWLDRKALDKRPPVLRRRDTDKPLHVLVAEDNPINQRVAVALLEKLGCQAQAVANGREVLSAIESVSYDVVLMDCQLPELDGFETTRVIRRQEEQRRASGGGDRKRVRVIAMTAFALRGAREQCLAAGMDDYISKPVHLEALTEALRRSLGEAAAPAAAEERAPPSPDRTPLDLSALETLRALRQPGRPDPLRELIDMFLQEAPARLEAMQRAMVRYEASELAAAAHRLKGCAATLGAEVLAGLCGEVEERAHAGAVQDAAGLLRRVRTEYERAREALETEKSV